MPLIRAELIDASRRFDEDAAAFRGGRPWAEVWPSLAESPSPSGPLAKQLLNWFGHPTCSQLAYAPLFAAALGSPRVLEVARRALNAQQLRIPQAAAVPYRDASPTREPDQRSFHTDWPHDLTAYVPDGCLPQHSGAVAQPFPPVCLCLSCVWYLDGVDADSGGT